VAQGFRGGFHNAILAHDLYFLISGFKVFGAFNDALLHSITGDYLFCMGKNKFDAARFLWLVV